MDKLYETPRLILKTLGPDSAEQVTTYCLENKNFLETYEPAREAYFYTAQHQQQILSLEQEEMDQLKMLRLWLFLKTSSETAAPIGNFAFTNIVRGAFQSCFLGYKLDHRYVNQGYMTEALTKGIDIIFNDYNLHRIEANIMPSNGISLRITQKLGFEEEGLALKYLKINHQWEDHYHMVLRNKLLE